MKSSRILISAAFLILLSCSKEVAVPPICELEVSCAQTGKISLSETLRTVWDSGDALSVFYGNELNSRWLYKGEDKATAGKIEGPGSVILEGRVVALYPYSETASLDGDKLVTHLEEEQTFCRGTFSPAGAVMYAKGPSNPLNFEYATSIAVLNLEAVRSCRINSVDFSSLDGRDVSGTFSISLDDGVVTTSGCDRISIPYGNVLEGGCSESFYFCIPAGEYESGIQFTVHIEGEDDKVVRYTPSLSLKGGDLLVVEDCYCRTYAVELDFSSNSPFDQKFPTSAYKGTQEYSLTVPGLGPLSFVISSTKGGFRYYSKMLRLNDGVDSGDAYIKLPGVPGYVLSEISLLISNQSGKTFRVGTSPGLSDICDPQTVPSGVKTTLSLNHTGGDCYLSVTAKNAQIISLGLLYY